MNRIFSATLSYRIAWALLLTLVGSGCGKAVVEEASEAAIEAGLPDGSKVEIGQEGGTIKIQGPDGNVSMETGESVALPANFPADIPVPDGVTWQMVQGAQSDGNSTLVVQGSLATPLAEVAATMKKNLEGQAWESVSSFQQTGEAEMLAYKKGERELSITISKDGDKTALLITTQ